MLEAFDGGCPSGASSKVLSITTSGLGARTGATSRLCSATGRRKGWGTVLFDMVGRSASSSLGTRYSSRFAKLEAFSTTKYVPGGRYSAFRSRSSSLAREAKDGRVSSSPSSRGRFSALKANEAVFEVISASSLALRRSGNLRSQVWVCSLDDPRYLSMYFGVSSLKDRRGL